MKDLKVKQNVLQEIMDLMDGRDGERLKSHPKFAAAKIEVKPEGESEEMPEMDEADEKSESPEMEKSEGELSPDDIQMLLEKLKDLE